MKVLFAKLLASSAPLLQIQERILAEANAMYDEDIAACKAMGAFGAVLLPDEGGVLTHCNAGALATCGYGTALGVIRAAVERGSASMFMPTRRGRSCRERGSRHGS